MVVKARPAAGAVVLLAVVGVAAAVAGAWLVALLAGAWVLYGLAKLARQNPEVRGDG